MDGLVEFLRARLVEREQALRALAKANPMKDELPELARGPMLLIQAAPDGREAEAFRELLADVEAKRRIIDLHDGNHECSTYDRDGEIDSCTWVIGDCSTLQLLALPFAEHPDYRPEWVPAGQV